MTYKELEEQFKQLKDKLIVAERNIAELKNISTQGLNPLKSDYRALQRASDERFRIDSKLMVCKIITGTTNASAGTESTHAHMLGRTPNVVLVLPDANATVYKSKASDSNNFYLKSSANSTPFTAFILY